MCEHEEFDLEVELEELELMLSEMDKAFEVMDKGFEWWEVIEELPSLLDYFDANINALRKGIESAEPNNTGENYFLLGTLLSGVISFYEGFVHDLINVCLNKSDYFERALANTKELDESDRKYFCFKKNINGEEFKEKLKRTTLHNPIRVEKQGHTPDETNLLDYIFLNPASKQIVLIFIHFRGLNALL